MQAATTSAWELQRSLTCGKTGMAEAVLNATSSSSTWKGWMDASTALARFSDAAGAAGPPAFASEQEARQRQAPRSVNQRAGTWVRSFIGARGGRCGTFEDSATLRVRVLCTAQG